MGQLADIQLNDGTEDLTFKPSGIDSKGVARLVNGDGVLVSDKVLTVSARQTSTRRKTMTKLELPVVQQEVINGISNPSQVRIGYIKIETDFGVFATTAERDAAAKLAASALANALISGVIVNNDTLY